MTNAQKMKDAIDLLETFALDYQFDSNDPGYLGFLNVGLDTIPDQRDRDTWTYICANRALFDRVVSELGLATEHGLDLEETVFVKK